MCTVRAGDLLPGRTSFLCVVAALLAVASGAGSQEKPRETKAKDPAVSPRLVEIKRVCVEKFGDDPLGMQAQEMVIARLFEAKRFSLTENCERADYILKGSVTERLERSFRSESEGIGFGTRVASRTGSGASSSSDSVAVSGTTHENLSSSETKEHAAVTLRVVDKEGDILWAVSMESTGGKTKGAIGDAAERAVRRFLRDIEKAEKQFKNARP